MRESIFSTSQNFGWRSAEAVLKILEEKGNVYQITLNGEPIWWFARMRVYDRLVDKVSNLANGRNRKKMCDNFCQLIYNMIHLLIIFCRALFSLWRLRKIRYSSGKVLVFAASNDYRGRVRFGSHAKQDVFLGEVVARLGNNAVFVERPTSLVWDFRSLIMRRDVIFWDCILILATIKCVLRPWFNLEGWEKFIISLYTLHEKLPLEVSLVEETIKEVMYEISKKVQILMTAGDMLLDIVGPSKVLEVTSYDNSCVALNLAAKRRRITVTEVQHGIIYPNHPGYASTVPHETGISIPVPDKTLVYGEKFKEYLLASTPLYKNKLIRVVGSPRLTRFLDVMYRNGRSVIRNQVRQKLHLKNNLVVLAVTTQKPVAKSLTFFLRECIKILPTHVRICLKPHPGELGAGLAVYKTLTKDSRVKIVTDSDIDLYELLVASDIHISSYSTVLLEAMALGVPNLVIGFENSLSFMDIFNSTFLPVICYPRELVEAVSRYESDPSWTDNHVIQGLEMAEGFFDTSIPDPAAAIIEELFR